MITKSLSKVVSNISWLLGDKVLDVILRITVGVLIARYLGAEWFGHLHFSLALIAILVPIAQLGLNSIVVKYIALEPENSGKLMGTSFFLQLMSSLVLCLGIISILNYPGSEKHVTDLFASILAVTLIFRSSDAIVSWNQSQVVSKYTVWATRISMIFGLLIKLALIHFSVTFIYFVIAWFLESLARAYLLFYFYLKRESVSSWVFDKKIAVKLLKESWPMMFSGVAAIVYLKIDVVMLGKMQGGTEVGVYSAAVRISELFYFLPTIVAATLLPAIVRSRINDPGGFYVKSQALLDALALYSIVAVGFLFFCSELLILTLYGAEYSAASNILKLHAFALLFVATGTARDKLLIAESRTVFILVSTSVGAVLNVLLNWYLIPIYAGNGAAVATIISYGFSGYLACMFWRPCFNHFKMITASFFVFARPALLVRFLISLRTKN